LRNEKLEGEKKEKEKKRKNKLSGCIVRNNSVQLHPDTAFYSSLFSLLPLLFFVFLFFVFLNFNRRPKSQSHHRQGSRRGTTSEVNA